MRINCMRKHFLLRDVNLQKGCLFGDFLLYVLTSQNSQKVGGLVLEL